MSTKKKAKDKELTKKATGEEKEFHDPALTVEGTKVLESENPEEQKKPEKPVKPEVVRGEDVLKRLREKGMKI